MRVYIVKISDFNELDIKKYLPFIKGDKRKRIDECKNSSYERQLLIGELLLIYVLSKLVITPYRDINITKNKYGKPYINTNSNVHYNMSHSGDIIACVFNIDQIGIDIELKKKINYLPIIDNCFTKSEKEWIIKKDQNKALESFYLIWTCKEAYFKCLGIGIYKKMKLVEFSIHDKKYYNIKDGKNRYYLISSEYNRDYILSVCSTNKSMSDIEIMFVESEELMDRLDKVLM